MRIAVLICALPLFGFAQWGQTNPSIDPFTKEILVTSGISKHYAQGMCLHMMFNRRGDAIRVVTQISKGTSVWSIGYNDELWFMLENDSVIKLESLDIAVAIKNGGISTWDCVGYHGLTSRYLMKPSDVELMMESPPKMMRVHTSTGYRDLSVSERALVVKQLNYVLSATAPIKP